MSPDVNWFSRMMLALAGILGAAGVIAAAVASHAGNERVIGAVALVALTQASALLAFGLLSPAAPIMRAGALFIGGGTCLFTGALAAGVVLDGTSIPILAPTGGGALVVGWITVALAGVAGRR